MQKKMVHFFDSEKINKKTSVFFSLITMESSQMSLQLSHSVYNLECAVDLNKEEAKDAFLL